MKTELCALNRFRASNKKILCIKICWVYRQCKCNVTVSQLRVKQSTENDLGRDISLFFKYNCPCCILPSYYLNKLLVYEQTILSLKRKSSGKNLNIRKIYF